MILLEPIVRQRQTIGPPHRHAADVETYSTRGGEARILFASIYWYADAGGGMATRRNGN